MAINFPQTYPSPPSINPNQHAPPLNPDPHFPPPPRPTWSSFSRPLYTSFLLHSGLAVSTHALAAVATNYRLDAKDVIWPGGMLLDAWYQSVGVPVIWGGRSVGDVISGFGWRESLILGGITTHSLRLMYHLWKRAYKRGHDDIRYAYKKTEKSNWYLRSLVTDYLPEALFQTLICLPFTSPFRYEPAPGYSATWNWTDSLAVFLWTAGFAMETLADYQLSKAKKSGKTQGHLMTEGVWSIVRHPNYLSNILTHVAYPLLLVSTPLSHPALVLGPLANYVFLRFFGGDALTETYQEQHYAEAADYTKLGDLQEYRHTRNAVWPGLEAVKQGWTWAVVGLGAAGVVLERGLRAWAAPRVL
ncbi:DUF1295-domain-containing protein [Gloeophyllum trabeum ATCC 11539]|uniref:DUF1295-domain-containing protein n=1 Tax=Gloeophyllum trabeum (strain ATCC 11539 / FP-39264 / Madison 617) TaxID=670483 RepID=S7QCL2_GLOTA|nr:DUF1295-domain-containing protein [Gloeophyllum trabeum ATCC 11539]EPQ57087.1 DUF1295-domain-containing protein [Gloeophyllum trabeum ATCC 11539]